MLGDTEYEGILWFRYTQKWRSEDIKRLCSTTPDLAASRMLMSTYLSDYNQGDQALTPVILGGLDFIADARTALPNYVISQGLRQLSLSSSDTRRDAQDSKSLPTKVYQYMFDEVNPFFSSTPLATARAHHALDLLTIFGGYDSDIPNSSTFHQISSTVREKYVLFVNSIPPWSSLAVYAYGPDGVCGEVSHAEYFQGRRVRGFETLASMTKDEREVLWRRITKSAGPLKQSMIGVSRSDANDNIEKSGQVHDSKAKM